MHTNTNIKESLIQNAVAQISARSYASVGVQELCELSGVTKGGFYYHFKSKEELTLAAINSIWDSYKSTILEPVFDTDLPTFEKFNLLIETVYVHYVSQKKTQGRMCGCRLGNLAIELSTQNESIRKKLEEIFEDWISYFEYVLKAAVAKKELPENTDTKKSAQSILAFLQGLALLGKTSDDPEFMKNLSRAVSNLIIDSDQKTITLNSE
jgi:TetR/AcrR family transcriptional repressor of nem operon